MSNSFLIKFAAALVGAVAILFVIDVVGDMLMQPRTTSVAETEVPADPPDVTEIPDEIEEADEVVEEDELPDAKEDEVVVVTEDPADPLEIEDPEEVVTDTGATEASSETLLAAADATKGARAARKCTTCHTFELGGANKIGPALGGVIGREIGMVDGFRYSNAMASTGGFWTIEALNEYIRDPRGVVPGTNMAFVGIRKEEERLDLIKYMSQMGEAN